jgi:hypothetical protein
VNARTALADQDSRAARQHLQSALAIVEEFDVPVAAWRVHATASEICRGEPEAERHRALARGVILRIANSFEDDEPLKESLLSGTPVRRLFELANRVGES